METNPKYDIWRCHIGHDLTCKAAKDLDGIPEVHIMCLTCNEMVFAVPRKTWGAIPPGLRPDLQKKWEKKLSESK